MEQYKLLMYNIENKVQQEGSELEALHAEADSVLCNALLNLPNLNTSRFYEEISRDVRDIVDAYKRAAEYFYK